MAVSVFSRKLVVGLLLLAVLVTPAAASRGVFGFSYAIANGYPQVTLITPGSPAHIAGLMAGDYILSIDGQSLSGLSQQQASLAMAGTVGQTQTLEIMRGQQTGNFTMTRIPAGNTTPAPTTTTTSAAPAQRGIFGYVFQAQNGLPVITSVTPGLPASQAGLQVGDYVVAIDGQSLRGMSAAQMTTAHSGVAGQTQILTIARGNQQYQVRMTRVAAPASPGGTVVSAIPSTSASPARSDQRGIFGFTFTVSERHGLPLITAVTPGYPGAQAGIQTGDMIVSIDGRNLHGLNQNMATIALQGVAGATQMLVIRRGGQDYNVSLTRVPAQPSTSSLPTSSSAPTAPAPSSAQRGIFGLTFTVSDQYGLPLITAVTPGYPGAQAGIQTGDMIVSIDGRDLHGLNQNMATIALQGVAGATNMLVIRRSGQDYNVSLTRVLAR